MDANSEALKAKQNLGSQAGRSEKSGEIFSGERCLPASYDPLPDLQHTESGIDTVIPIVPVITTSPLLRCQTQDPSLTSG
jgi:hypothetical protein